MSNEKVSQLPSANTPLNSGDYYSVVQSLSGTLTSGKVTYGTLVSGLAAFRTIGVDFGGSGTVVGAQNTTGEVFDFPYAGTLSSIYVRCDVSSTLTLDIYRTATGTSAPTSSNSIIGSATVGITAGVLNVISSFSSWPSGVAPTFAIGDQIAYAVKTNNNATFIKMQLVIAITGS